MEFYQFESLPERNKSMKHIQLLLNDHPSLFQWVQEVAELTKPQNIHLCTGSSMEIEALLEKMTLSGTLKKLNPELRPNSYLALSDKNDVARVEDKTYVCSLTQELAGPNNNWEAPEKMKSKLSSLFSGCMKGRTLFVVPFCMGPLDSPYSRFGVEITDSPYVVVNMNLMTRIGSSALSAMKNKTFVKALHSVGSPLQEGEQDKPWPCNEEKYIVHFPESYEIWSFGSGYGGNALLGKKCFALRIGSKMGLDEGWLAEHMLIMGAENEKKEKKYFLAAFPSACGKTNFAMMVPPQTAFANWKVTTVGDDIAWIHRGPQGDLRAINPEYGFFGVAPGTSYQTNPIAMDTIKSNTLFTNVALTPDGDVWWEGLTPEPPPHLTDWLGQEWTPDCGRLAAHPNARFTVSIKQCPTLDENWENPQGVPVDAFLFGGRRQNTLPLVFKAKDWNHGVYFAASIGSETTAAAVGEIGRVRRDPLAMLPFCGYNMALYFKHWLDMQKLLTHKPSFFIVNWFKKNELGKYAWPGFGDNMRVLSWIFNELQTPSSHAVETPLGFMPNFEDMNWVGLSFSKKEWDFLMNLAPAEWEKEILSHSEFFNKFGSLLPEELWTIQKKLSSFYVTKKPLP